MWRRATVVPAAMVVVALVLSGCTSSSGARLSNDLIPARSLQSAPWGLRLASVGRTVNPFGAEPSGGLPIPVYMNSANTVAIRQWVGQSGAVSAGPLPEGIFSVIDRGARFRSTTDAQTLIADLTEAYGTNGVQGGTGVRGAVVLPAPFRFNVSGGQVSGREDLVIIERGVDVFTVLVVGGGSRPTWSDVEALASLQASAIPASVR